MGADSRRRDCAVGRRGCGPGRGSPRSRRRPRSRDRSSWFDPALADLFDHVARDSAFCERVASPDVTAHVAVLESAERVVLADDDRLDLIAEAFGAVVDAKSPFTSRHSERVAETAAGIGTVLGLGASALRDRRRLAGSDTGFCTRGVVPYSGGGGGRTSNLPWDHRPIPPMARLLLSTLIEDASASDDATVSRVVRTLLRSPVTDAERVGERLCVYGWECSRPDSQVISWRYKVVGEDSGTEYVSFGLAMPTGPDLLLSVFGLQLQIALNGLASTSEDEVGCFMELMAAVRAA